MRDPLLLHYDWQVSLQQEASLELTAWLSAFTNQICSWDFERNFEFSWQLTCEVLVLGKQNVQDPFEFTKKKKNPPLPLHPSAPSTPRLSAFPETNLHCSALVDSFPSASRNPCFTPERQNSSWRLKLLASNCRQVKLFLNYKAKLRVLMCLWSLVLGQSN